MAELLAAAIIRSKKGVKIGDILNVYYPWSCVAPFTDDNEAEITDVGFT